MHGLPRKSLVRGTVRSTARKDSRNRTTDERKGMPADVSGRVAPVFHVDERIALITQVFTSNLPRETKRWDRLAHMYVCRTLLDREAVLDGLRASPTFFSSSPGSPPPTYRLHCSLPAVHRDTTINSTHHHEAKDRAFCTGSLERKDEPMGSQPRGRTLPWRYMQPAKVFHSQLNTQKTQGWSRCSPRFLPSLSSLCRLPCPLSSTAFFKERQEPC